MMIKKTTAPISLKRLDRKRLKPPSSPCVRKPSKGFMTDEEIDAEIQAARNEEDPCNNLSAIAESLFGSIPDTLTLEEARKERLKEKYGL